MSTFSVRSTAPDAYIIFFPYDITKTVVGADYSSDYLKTKPLFVRSDIMSIQTTKGKGGPGSWSCTLSPRYNYKSKIQPGIWCMIFMSDEDLGVGTTEEEDTRKESPLNNNGPDSGFKMLGIVRSVRATEITDPSSGTRSLRYDISGDDFHSVLDAQVYLNPSLRPGGDEKSSPIIDAQIFFKRQMDKPYSPADMCNLLIDAMLGVNEGLGEGILASGGSKAGAVYGLPPEVARRLTGVAPESGLFVDTLKRAIETDLLGTIAQQPQLASQFSLWSMLESYAHRLLNELYTELLPLNGNIKGRLVPTIVLRPIPFTSNGFNPTHLDTTYSAPVLQMGKTADVIEDGQNFLYTSREVGEEDIFGLNFGKSDSERFNYFFVSSNFANDQHNTAPAVAPLLGDSHNKNSQQPLGDSNSIARNGLRPFITSSNYLSMNLNNNIATNLIIRDLWGKAHLFENGQVQLVGSKRYIPVGTNITFKDRGWLAHVESVSNSYNVGSGGIKNFRTSIAFVRLQTVKGNPIDLEPDARSRKDYQANITSNRGDKQ